VTLNARMLACVANLLTPAAVTLTIGSRLAAWSARTGVATWRRTHPARPDQHDSPLLVLAPVIPLASRRRHIA
jgi:hypothetical protein